MIHHCDEEVEKNDNVDHGEASKHNEGPESRELLDAGQLEVVKVDQSKCRPEQRLTRLPKTGKQQGSFDIIDYF